MSSIIEGYNYDIFISYRQKDNKHDGWVTEFVDNLKGELESTFKEDVSVYFDINPHDGLLETHDVGASLKEKLKCLIFIPIISRTFCDPKSFAWEHEFKAFVDLASNDRFGLMVKLPGGNVSGRVLPVRIHDLAAADIRECEAVLGGVLRGVEFIYKSQGVNRPLRSKEDNPHDNLNHTTYRDQINKVANAVSEIITGLQSEKATPPVEPEVETRPAKVVKVEKKTLLYSLSSSLIVIMALVSFFLFSSGSTLPFTERDWVVITDFENQTQNPVFDKSLYTAFSLSASQSSYVNVIPRSRMIETMARMEAKDRTTINDSTGREIATREGVAIYIVPSISEVGNRYVITAKILETKTGNLLKSEVLYAETVDGILPALDRLSKNIRRHFGESRYRISTQDKPLSKVTTSSLDALKLYSLGIEHHLLLDFEGAKDYYEKALRIDTGFIAAKASLGNILIEKFDSIDKGRELLSQAVKSVDRLTEREKLGILAFYAINVENDLPKAIKYAGMRIDLYPDDPVAHSNLGWYYQNSGKFEEALKEYKAAVRINRNLALTYSGILWIYLEKLGQPDSAIIWAGKMITDNPQNAWGYSNLGAGWISLDSLDKAESAFTKAREINPDFTVNLFRLAHTYRLQGRNDKAIGILKEILKKNPDEASAYYDSGINYQAMGNPKEARRNFYEFKRIATEDWVQRWPDNAATYIAIAAASARLNEMESSNLMLRKAMGIDSTLHDRFTEVYCAQGNINDALNELGKSLNDGYRNLFWLKISPDLQILQSEARYRNLINKYFR
jgi:tetratricopeptide (TPR) repeat protein